MAEPILRMEGIVKNFPGVRALDNVNFNVYSGEVMALLGENGAGKSTLVKVLTGVYRRDAGKIVYQGREVEYSYARQAQSDGIAIIHQELNLIPKMRIYENIFLGRELKGKMGGLNRAEMIRVTRGLLERIRMPLDPNATIETLSIAQQQMVEIAKALLSNARVIVMDEPTDALPDEEVDSLFDIIRSLKAEGVAIVYISHRLKEIFQICDRATVLRDGTFIAETKVGELTLDRLISMMVGRTLSEQYPYERGAAGEAVLSVRNLTNHLVKDVSFDAMAGQVLGVTGLVGAGRTELMQTLYGAHEWHSGSVSIMGKPYRPKNPHQAIESGLYYMTEDRKRNGLVLILDVKTNITLSALERFTRRTRIDRRKEREACEDYIRKIQIKTPSLKQLARNLSGGNQQKIVLSKALLTRPKVLILDEPTRGIDVGAKKEIYGLINRLKEQGVAIIMISSEMPEILGMSDRVMVMGDGRVKGRLERGEASQERIMEIILS